MNPGFPICLAIALFSTYLYFITSGEIKTILTFCIVPITWICLLATAPFPIQALVLLGVFVTTKSWMGVE